MKQYIVDTEGKRKVAPHEKIAEVFNKWILCVYDEDTSIEYNNFFSGEVKTKDSEDAKGKLNLFLPDGVASSIERKTDVREAEMVFRVHMIGPDADSPVEIGDSILVKGNVVKMFTDPIMYGCYAENIVGKLRSKKEIAKLEKDLDQDG